MSNSTTRYSHLDTPIGHVLLVGDEDGLAGLFVADHERCPARQPDWKADDSAFVDVRRQLGEYFDGTRTTFDLPLCLAGSRFQVEVWSALRDIPYGHTIGYGELARRIGRPTAARAVGAANGSNPISIIIPCHRVIGADGSLTGYGWGVERKAWLIGHERAGTPRQPVDLSTTRPIGPGRPELWTQPDIPRSAEVRTAGASHSSR